jgi:hypothetical protein
LCHIYIVPSNVFVSRKWRNSYPRIIGKIVSNNDLKKYSNDNVYVMLLAVSNMQKYFLILFPNTLGLKYVIGRGKYFRKLSGDVNIIVIMLNFIGFIHRGVSKIEVKLPSNVVVLHDIHI